MGEDALAEDWAILRQWLPEDLDERARRCGFIRRQRGLTDCQRWLRLILMHVGGGLSLAQTAVRARELGLASISAVALFKRLRKAEPWLRDLCAHLLAEQQRRLGRVGHGAGAGAWPSAYRVRVVDASVIQEPGDTGALWRLHYSIRLPELICDHYELSDVHGGEKLGRFGFAAGDLVLADRGYSHRAGAAQVLESGADLLLRWNPSVLPVRQRSGKPFNLLAKLRRLPRSQAGHWPVQFEFGGRTYPLRLCALPKSRLAAERARTKTLRKAKRNGTKAQAGSLELSAYLLVLTSLPETFSAPQVLELYRCRWQIELAFKRLKSLLSAGHLPKNEDLSARSWMQAKLLSALLLERLLIEAKLFSPWGYELPAREPLAVDP